MASLLVVDLKADVLTVSQRMGHGDPSVTLKGHGHHFEGARQTLTDQLDALRETTAGASEPAQIIDISRAETSARRARRGHAKGTKTGPVAINRGQARATVFPGRAPCRASDLDRRQPTGRVRFPSPPRVLTRA